MYARKWLSCKLLVATVLVLTATLAQGAGLRAIDIPADAGGPALKGAIWSPCSQPPGEVDFGKLILPGVKDCPLPGEKLPLIVVSHGRRGNFLGHIDTAQALADAGFIVAAINHPGDTQGYRMFKSISTRKLSSQAARLSLPRNEVFVSG